MERRAKAQPKVEALNPVPGALIILTGPTASGKTEIRERMIAKHNGLQSLVTTTSRAMRADPKDGRRPEIDGVDYHFVSPERFLEMVENGEFVEHVLYPGGLYGTTKRELERILQGQSLMSTMEISGAAEFTDKVRESYDPDTAAAILNRTFVVFVEPESEETQRKWYEKRRTGLGDLETRIVQDRLLEERFGIHFAVKVVNVDGQIDRIVSQVEQLIEKRFETPLSTLF